MTSRPDRVRLRFATVLDARVVLRRLADEWDEGFSAGASPGGSSGPADPVGARVAADRPVEGAGLSARCRAAADRVDALVAELNATAFVVSGLLPLDHPVAEMLARHGAVRFIGAGVCQRDQLGVSGVGEDRLKAGWCPRCYRQWLRDGRPDRAQFNAGVSPTAGDSEGAGRCPNDTNVVMISGSGGVVRPTGDVGAD